MRHFPWKLQVPYMLRWVCVAFLSCWFSVVVDVFGVSVLYVVKVLTVFDVFEVFDVSEVSDVFDVLMCLRFLMLLMCGGYGVVDAFEFFWWF